MKRCYVCGRRIWFRPATFKVLGQSKPVHLGCLRAFIRAGKVGI